MWFFQLIQITPHEPYIKDTSGCSCFSSFSELRKKYGFPLIVMNLVKRREKSGHEAVLHNQFLKVADCFICVRVYVNTSTHCDIYIDILYRTIIEAEAAYVEISDT